MPLSKRVFVRSHSRENVFRLQVHSHSNQTHFHMKGFVRGLVLKPRHRVTRKLPVVLPLERRVRLDPKTAPTSSPGFSLYFLFLESTLGMHTRLELDPILMTKLHIASLIGCFFRVDKLQFCLILLYLFNICIIYYPFLLQALCSLESMGCGIPTCSPWFSCTHHHVPPQPQVNNSHI